MVTMEKIELFGNNFTFKFKEKTKNGLFYKQSNVIDVSMIQDYDQGSEAKIVEIVDVGPECSFKPGDNVLLEALMWTTGFNINGETVWKSDENHILAAVEE